MKKATKAKAEPLAEPEMLAEPEAAIETPEQEEPEVAEAVNQEPNEAKPEAATIEQVIAGMTAKARTQGEDQVRSFDGKTLTVYQDGTHTVE